LPASPPWWPALPEPPDSKSLTADERRSTQIEAKQERFKVFASAFIGVHRRPIK
jgi:hypothetical protein